MRRFLTMVSVLFLCSLPDGARAGDAELFADLIPGEPLAESEFGNVHGKGFSSSSSSSSSSLSSGFESISLRKSISESLRSVGVRPPLVPSAGLESRPKMDFASGAARGSAPRVELPSLRAPSAPRMPDFGARSISGSSSSSSVVSR